MKNRNKILYLCLSVLAAQFFISCNQDSIDETNTAIPYEPIGGYENSDDIAADNLIVKCSFEDNITDSKSGISDGNGTNVTYENGVKGKAYKGSSSAFIGYNTVSPALANVKSITVSAWIKTDPHTGGAQCLFMLPKTSDFWGNIFTLIEGTGPADTMLIKNHLQKDVTPSIPWSGQWLVHDGSNVLTNMFGNWKHLVWTYDAATSTYSMYVNGQNLNLPNSIAKRYTNDPAAGGVPYGDLANSDVSKFVIGGFQQHLGAPWGAADGWMLHYSGLLDEFRIYDKALSDNDVRSLYLLENDNR
ncbi:LamG domain-containing protein [Flavobacterium sp. IMCC34852]|uniref:LamG domain-containing protein n=1 Tax=Flavobacterium rivulicola TaxID=2732161 RepID=A0A7Y3RB86_9FLAO|nr:LamG domain-containing protein [Flavobacterium sp. IMCC34852]NNT72831.1 LamG domain-containing protein [Flavobacterium sp. IMCC34852]